MREQLAQTVPVVCAAGYAVATALLAVAVIASTAANVVVEGLS